MTSGHSKAAAASPEGRAYDSCDDAGLARTRALCDESRTARREAATEELLLPSPAEANGGERGMLGLSSG